MRSALTASPNLAHPEYDIDDEVEWFVFGHGSADEINTKMADNFRLLSVSARTPGSFAASLIRNLNNYQRAGNGWASGLTESQLLAIDADPARRIVDIAAYYSATDRQYAAVWLDNTVHPIAHKVVLHATPDAFKAAMAPTSGHPNGWRVIDVEARPIQSCSGGSCSMPSPTDFDVSGVAIANDGPDARAQIFGYGAAAGNAPLASLPPNTGTLLNESLGTAIAFGNGAVAGNARTGDFDSPFGDGNYFYVVEQVRDTNAVVPTDNGCTPTDVSTERNWWLTDLVFSDDNDFEAAVVANSRRLGARPAKIKPYNSTLADNGQRWLVTYYDNEVPPLGRPGNSTTPVLQKIDAVVQNRMKRWGEPAVALGVVKDGQLVYAQGYGYDNLGALRVTQPTDMFRLASVSKPITQSLILRLVQQGKLSLQAHVFGDILGYNPPGTPFSLCPSQVVTGTCQRDTLTYSPASPPDSSGCTLGDLKVQDILWHMSGLLNRDDSGSDNDAFAFDDDIGGAATPSRWAQNECDARAAGQAPFFRPPGSRSHYMNSEYQIMAAVIEQVTGKQYQDYLAEVLGPLQLNRIWPAHPSAEPDVDPRVQSIPYSLPFPIIYYGGSIMTPPNADTVTCPTPLAPSCVNHLFVGSGSMAAAPVDLLRWATAIDGSRGDNDSSIISKATFDGNMRVFYLDGVDGNWTVHPPGKQFAHGGYFPGDTQTNLNMRTDGISYFIATNADSLFGNVDAFCCPGTPPVACGPTAASLTCTDGMGNPVQPNANVPRWTHALGGSFMGEVDNDINIIFNSCPLPTGDHFGDDLPEPTARCHDLPVPADANCTATVTASQIDAGSTGGTSMTLSPPGPYGLGPNAVQLVVSDGKSVSKCNATITVQDQTAPTLTAPANVNLTTCDAGVVNFGAATATDNCAHPPQVKGSIIAANGVSIPPIDVSSGSSSLGPGSYTIQWTATDGVNASPPVTQTVTLRAGVQASQTFSVDDRGVLKQVSGAPAALYNSGTGSTLVSYDAHSGTIVSRAGVQVLDRAVIGGGITTAGDLNVSATASVSGTQTKFATLPPMSGLPSLPAFQNPNLGDVSVNNGATVPMAPGSRTNVTVNSGTLVLQAGTYYIRNFTVNSGTTVRAPAGTIIYVKDTLAFRSSIRQLSGSTIQPVTLGFAGTTTTLEAVFNGTFIAPNATVALGTGSGLTFTGAFYAKGLEIRPASTLVCQASFAVPPS